MSSARHSCARGWLRLATFTRCQTPFYPRSFPSLTEPSRGTAPIPLSTSEPYFVHGSPSTHGSCSLAEPESAVLWLKDTWHETGNPTNQYRWRIEPAQQWTGSRQLSTAVEGGVSSQPEGEARSSSWLDRFKGMLGGKKGEEKKEGLTLDQFADQLKQLRRFGSLAQFGRGLPRGGEQVVQRAITRQEEIIRAMTPEERANLDKFGAEARARVAKQCQCSVADVDDVISKFCWFREAAVKVDALKAAGKPVPKTLGEVEELMGGRWSPQASRSLGSTPGQGPSRNAPCPCGSGKKYKRCCGATGAS